MLVRRKFFKRLNRRQSIILIVSLLSIIVLASVYSAFSAANFVPNSLLHESSLTIYPIDLIPAECDGHIIPLWLVVVSGGGWTDGTPDSDLILGTNGVDRARGREDDDCIVGGDGNDRLNGNTGDDIILGGDGKDKVTGGAGYDICYTGGGGDKANDFDCEEVHWP
jgi:Ca2+-binding RTX toxin-like protein